jgi:hypothetical protein
LEPLLTPISCSKDSHVEILSITFRGLLIIVVYASDGKETEGTDVLLSILDRAVITGSGTILVIGDPKAQLVPWEIRQEVKTRPAASWIRGSQKQIVSLNSFHHQDPRTENQVWHPSWASYSFTGFITTPSESLNTIHYPLVAMV